ncbi:HAD family phosphatase [Streptomyces sp. TRM49041]|uniref:HAD family phosphatase n=1 Tax=Streptomyces sp. TRM49041 TaxID=2603216 RepID=UPI0011EE7623|nr:HAD family phosphatase [Streptomyces sp. TRM49041]
MAEKLKQLKLAAVNIDGVLLNDTFSPVIHNFIVSRGGEYTAEVERSIFSQPQLVGGQGMANAARVPWTAQEAIDVYFKEREEYLRDHPVELIDGAVELLRRLRALGLKTVSYGGLDKAHFDTYLGGRYGDLFDEPGYVCTNDFRPGLREITTEVFGLEYDQVLFIDDVARVAEVAKALDIPFIGHPSSFEHSFQPQLMREAGARHIVGSLHAIDEDLLHTLDAEAAARSVWHG